MNITININSKIHSELQTEAIRRAMSALTRDMRKVFIPTQEEGHHIYLIKDVQKRECFCTVTSSDGLEIRAADELGFVYGLYEFSHTFLGIKEFWFWNDQKITRKKDVEIPGDYYYQSELFRVKLRGWFVNDEVLLHTWEVDGDKDKPWEMVFETLLRLGGNMVIPGTDQNARHYRKLAADMGLYMTHHHAEPLGAEMFARAYPNLKPSYKEHPEKFEHLWKQGILDQKDQKTVWNLGFRGQGDCPFWEDDPQYDTQESRGQLISELIRKQYEMVKGVDPKAICCTNLYGETMELYREGVLDLPEGVIKIWADNGYGKMVSRRQNNHNPRVVSLPEQEDHSKHGIYYHVSFYDLQAANHITMLPNNPEFVCAELKEVLSRGMDDYWIINCSNVKPHTYYLDMIAQIWRGRILTPELHRRQYIMDYYGMAYEPEISRCLEAYYVNALQYGIHQDEHAGEQFANHIMRMLVSQYMRNSGEKNTDLEWAVKTSTLAEQVQWYEQLCKEAWQGYEKCCQLCEKTALELKEGAQLFSDTIWLQTQIYDRCYKGAAYACESLLKALAGEYKQAFYLAGKGRDEYIYANRKMRDSEHDKWKGFYANECLTDIKQSGWVLEILMGYLRNIGDGPHFYEWQREFLYSEEDRRVMLVMNMDNHLNNDLLYTQMQKCWEG